MTNYQLGTLERALRLLDEIAARPGQRLHQLSTALDANESTVLRTLRVLERGELVRRAAAESTYTLGPKLAELGRAAAEGIDIVRELRRHMVHFVSTDRATVHISTMTTGGVTVLDKIDAPNLTITYSTVGTRMPLHATAAGKAALALAGDDAVNALRPGPLPAFTTHTATGVDALMLDVALTRKRGFSLDAEEYHAGFACVGSSFRWSGHVYAVSLSGPVVSDSVLDDRGRRLRDAMGDFATAVLGSSRHALRASDEA